MTTLTTIETRECPRCGGTGHYSFNHLTGSVCFRCNGAKRIHTKRGAKAHRFLRWLRSKPVADIHPGDSVQHLFGLPIAGHSLVRTFAKVIRCEPLTLENAECRYLRPDGTTYVPQGWLVELQSAHHGGVLLQVLPDTWFRVAHTAQAKKTTLATALAFQNTLTKSGKPTAATAPFLQGYNLDNPPTINQ